MIDKNNAAFVYGINMLRFFLSMKLITKEEYAKIKKLQAEYYGINLYLLDD